MTVTSILAIFGILIAALAVVLTFLFRDRDLQAREEQHQNNLRAIQDKQQSFCDQAENLLKTTEEFINEHRLQSGATAGRPDIFLSISTAWTNFQKLFLYRTEKQQICHIIVREIIKQRMDILIDSGSTVDYITAELSKAPIKGVHVRSNNLLAALHLFGDKSVKFSLLEGIFSDRWVAVYSESALSKIRDIPANLYIIAAVAFRYDSGIFVEERDKENREFKVAALNAFKRNHDSKLVIAIDPSKFSYPLEGLRAILEKDDWDNLMTKDGGRITVVSTIAGSSFSQNAIDQYNDQMHELRQRGLNTEGA